MARAIAMNKIAMSLNTISNKNMFVITITTMVNAERIEAGNIFLLDKNHRPKIIS